MTPYMQTTPDNTNLLFRAFSFRAPSMLGVSTPRTKILNKKLKINFEEAQNKKAPGRKLVLSGVGGM
jgi:hypothetical protein